MIYTKENWAHITNVNLQMISELCFKAVWLILLRTFFSNWFLGFLDVPWDHNVSKPWPRVWTITVRVECFQPNWTICWHKKHPFGLSLSVGPFFLSLRILSVASTAFATSANLKTIQIQSYIFFELNIQRDYFRSSHIFFIWTFHAALYFKIIW